MTSGLSETDIENIRKQNIEPVGPSVTTHDLSMVMELSKRDEEARLNRLREEEEELEKVGEETARVPVCSSKHHRFKGSICCKSLIDCRTSID